MVKGLGQNVSQQKTLVLEAYFFSDFGRNNYCMDVIQGDRRLNRRYQIGLRLSYEATAPDGACSQGTGWTRNLSSTGISFDAPEALQPGSSIALRIDWPLRLQDVCPLELMVQGSVLRSGGEGTVVAMDRYELKTRGRRSFDEPVECELRLIGLG